MTKGPVEVDDGIWVTGAILRRTAYEDTGGLFYLEAGFTQSDLIHDDQALWLESKAGIVVLLGCAHAASFAGNGICTTWHVRLLVPSSSPFQPDHFRLFHAFRVGSYETFGSNPQWQLHRLLLLSLTLLS